MSQISKETVIQRLEAALSAADDGGVYLGLSRAVEIVNSTPKVGTVSADDVDKMLERLKKKFLDADNHDGARALILAQIELSGLRDKK